MLAEAAGIATHWYDPVGQDVDDHAGQSRARFIQQPHAARYVVRTLFQSSESTTYGVAWSEHIHLLPAAEVELTFTDCSYAKTNPIDGGTLHLVKDGFRVIFDKDGILAELADAVMTG